MLGPRISSTTWLVGLKNARPSWPRSPPTDYPSPYPHLKWIGFTRKKRDVHWGLVPSTMFRERHRLMVRDGMMKSLSCLVWVESRACWTL
uniref:Uncharacterized protein n=1 Tax=Brassica oleracea var. oleracea TaxID=109376 RepID=A0A0D3A8Z5_BRAOL